VVVRADSRSLEYYVVRDTTPGHAIERLVPRTRVNPGELAVVHLECTRAELGQMQPLNVQELQSAGPRGAPSNFYGNVGNLGAVDSERAPDGTGVLRQDQRVEATNGNIGKLIGITIDDDARITHFYTRLDSRGSPELFLPVSAVSFVDRTTVYLRLDKHQLESLPSLPAQTDKSGEPATKHMELLAQVYDTPVGAGEAFDQLSQSQEHAEHPIKIREAAVLVREGDGPTRLEDKGKGKGPGKSVVAGVAVGGMLAMLGPIGLVAGAVAGGAVGGLAGSHVDLGFPKAFLDRLKEGLKPDHSALVLLIEHDWEQDLAEVHSVLAGAMSHDTLVETLVQEMLASEQPPVPAN
jgi:uncharacterized membrane protein